MTPFSDLLLIAFCAAAFAYADMIRVVLGGNAKLVMLRGALFGVAMSVFTFSSYFSGEPFFLAGICALASYPGGGFKISDHKENVLTEGFKGYVPAVVEAALTGGIFCGMISFYLSCAAGRFNVMQILMLFFLAPVFALCSYVFNKFYNTDKVFFFHRDLIIPLAGVTVSLIIFSCFSGDSLMISSTLTGIILFSAASAGSMILISFFTRFRFSVLHSNILHESIYGFLTGIAAAVTFVICSTPLKSRLDAIDTVGFSQVGLHPLAGILATFVFIFFAIDQIQYFIIPKWSRNIYLSEILGFLKRYEFLLYCVLPFSIACMGNLFLPEIISTVIIFVIAWQLLCQKVFLKNSDRYIYIVIFFIPILGLLFVRLSTSWILTSTYMISLYTIIFNICAFYLDYIENDRSRIKGKGLLRHISGFILSAFLIAGIIILPKVI